MKIYDWHKAEGLTAETLPEGTLREVMVADKRIGLLKRQEKIMAFT
jgi:hypothetical protein